MNTVADSTTVDKSLALIHTTGELVSVQDLSLARAPELVLGEAQTAAAALQRVIAGKKKPVIFNGEQYLEFEDWQTCARFYGVTAKVVSTQPVDFDGVRGFEARAVALLTATGQEISAADSMCLNDEPNWRNKPLFQLRSMAQTRACAKALRNVLAWVVVLAGFRPTPAEEMTGERAANGHATAAPIQPPQRKSQSAESTAEEGESDGALRIRTVKACHYRKKDGSEGEFWAITFSNGKEAATFDTKIAEAAEVFKADGSIVEVGLETSSNGKLKIVELSRVLA